MIVLDTPVIVALVLDNDPRGPSAKRALRSDREIAVAPLWRSELRSVLLKLHTAGKLTLDDVGKAFTKARRIVEACEVEPDARRVVANAAKFGLSSYDAEHYTVAETLGAMVLTADARTLVKNAPERCLLLGAFAAEP